LGYIGDILHHEIFDPAEVAQLVPQTGKHSEDLRGLPAGVFIFKFQPDHIQAGAIGDYYAVYYWGKGFLSAQGATLSYMINPWNGHCERATYADAVELFSLKNFRIFNAGVAEPYVRHPRPD
jgi:hypothetical protein